MNRVVSESGLRGSFCRCRRRGDRLAHNGNAGTVEAARATFNLMQLLLDAYLASVHVIREWQAAVASDSDRSGRKLLMARITLTDGVARARTF